MVASLSGKNILVTGGAGFIGCAISQQMAPQAAGYVVVDNLLPQVHPTATRPDALHKSAELVVADVADASTWNQLFAQFKPDVIVHLAAETGTGQSLTEASRHARTNVQGTTELLDALCRFEIKPEQIVLSSSRAVYGEGAWQNGSQPVYYPGQRTNSQLAAGKWDFDGEAKLSQAGKTLENPTSVYGVTKLTQENILKCWAASFDVPISILRFQNVYGPGQSPHNAYTGIVILFSQLAKAKRQIELFEDGLVTRDFVFIDDVADAIVAAVAKTPVGQPLRLLDIGSGEVTSLKKLATMLTDLHDAPPAVISGKHRKGDVRHARCDISKAASELGWRPKWSLSDGLRALQQHLAKEAHCAAG